MFLFMTSYLFCSRCRVRGMIATSMRLSLMFTLNVYIQCNSTLLLASWRTGLTYIHPDRTRGLELEQEYCMTWSLRTTSTYTAGGPGISIRDCDHFFIAVNGDFYISFSHVIGMSLCRLSCMSPFAHIYVGMHATVPSSSSWCRLIRVTLMASDLHMQSTVNALVHSIRNMHVQVGSRDEMTTIMHVLRLLLHIVRIYTTNDHRWRCIRTMSLGCLLSSIPPLLLVRVVHRQREWCKW